MVAIVCCFLAVSGRRKKRKQFGFPQFLKDKRRVPLQYPDELDEAFFREAQYCLNEQIVKGRPFKFFLLAFDFRTFSKSLITL